MQEELKHFEVKIEKHNHYQKQLEISHQKLRHVERFGDHEHVSRNKERYAMLEEKTKELGYKAGAAPGLGFLGGGDGRRGGGQGFPAPPPTPGLRGWDLGAGLMLWPLWVEPGRWRQWAQPVPGPAPLPGSPAALYR